MQAMPDIDAMQIAFESGALDMIEQPRYEAVQKLMAKVREGSRVKKIYDDPKTPYQRVLDSDQVSSEAKRKLRAIHAQLKVVELRRQLDALLEQLNPSKQW